MFNSDRIGIFEFIYFCSKYFNCTMNCLNMNHVTICRSNFLDIVTLKSFTDELFPL